jgi:hypothetical protein
VTKRRIRGHVRKRVPAGRSKPSPAPAADKKRPITSYQLGRAAAARQAAVRRKLRNFLPSLFHLAGAFAALARDVGPDGNGLHAALGGGNTMPLTAFYSAGGRLLDVERGALVPAGAVNRKIARLFGVTS